MKVKTSELVGVMLDYAVALCLGVNPQYNMSSHGRIWKGWWIATPYYNKLPNYSTNWQQGGPIIELNSISIIRCDDHYEKDKKGYCTNKRIPMWAAEYGGGHGVEESYGSQGDYFGDYYNLAESDCVYGPTPLIAAMRCYVASKMGNEIEIPEELVN